jgi:hypothetical protein
VTTNAYPFDNATTITVNWMGGNTTYYSGATSDKDGRTNTAAITGSTGTSAVQLCKNLGCGWYLPAYEELYAMSSGSASTYSNNRDGAGILTGDYHWSSSEIYNNGGRSSTNDTGLQTHAMVVSTGGSLGYNLKDNSSLYDVRCAWRP